MEDRMLAAGTKFKKGQNDPTDEGRDDQRKKCDKQARAVAMRDEIHKKQYCARAKDDQQ